MKINVWNTILQLSKERGVEPSVIIAAIEESLRVAASKFYSHGEAVQILFRPEKGELRVYMERKIVESPADPAHEVGLEEARLEDPSLELGEMLEIDLPSDTLGRIAAQAAKQVIVQKVRDAEQEKIYDEYAPRLGEIVSGVFRREEAGADVLEVNKTDVLLPLREKLPGDRFERGDRVRAVITQVRRGYKGQESQVIVSRATPKFLERLLSLEIPEISGGTIEIKDIIRQPGERAKVAVQTRERDVDPVGACIGLKGARILAISKELGGEKIDIIVWSANPAQYARAALSPARVENVIVADKNAKVLQAVVGPDQLSLAIGKKGINVKLASKLVGWKIAIQPHS
jgi:N utilization substance protein A